MLPREKFSDSYLCSRTGKKGKVMPIASWSDEGAASPFVQDRLLLNLHQLKSGRDRSASRVALEADNGAEKLSPTPFPWLMDSAGTDFVASGDPSRRQFRHFRTERQEGETRTRQPVKAGRARKRKRIGRVRRTTAAAGRRELIGKT